MSFYGINKPFRNLLFDILFNSAEIAKFAPRERNEYISDMDTIRDRLSQLATARREGREEGMEKGREEGIEMGKLEVAKAMLANGIARDVIVSCTGLTEEQLKAL